MAKVSRSLQHKARLDPMVSLDALDETEEMTLDDHYEPTKAGQLAVEIRGTAVKIKKLGSLNMMAQMQHGPALMAEAMGQMAYALELIEMNSDG